MVAFGSRLVVTACLLGCAHLLAQSSIRSTNAYYGRSFDSLWNEQTDNVWVAAAYGVSLVGKTETMPRPLRPMSALPSPTKVR